jgi:hypothetical protein
MILNAKWFCKNGPALPVAIAKDAVAEKRPAQSEAYKIMYFMSMCRLMNIIAAH